MRKFKFIFYLFYFGYFFVSIYFAFDIDAMFKQFGMFPFLRFLKFWLILGMSLLLVEWIIENIHIYQLRSTNKKLEKEAIQLKSEIYDLMKKTGKMPEDTTLIAHDSSAEDESKQGPTHVQP